MMKSILQRALTCGVALTALGIATTAHANDGKPGDPQPQTTPASTPPVAATDDYSGDIIITSQKRPERLRDVPLSITAITGEAIDKQGIKSFEDYANRAAGIHLSRDGTQSSFSVRGIASSSSADTTSATAGIYVDDYPLYDTWFRFASPDLRIFDVERIEVLRGPQGTLYGATSLSGSIRIITNKPQLDKVDASFDGTLSSTDRSGRLSYDTSAMINLPLVTDKVGIRAVGYVRNEAGYIDNAVRGASDVNSQRGYGGRVYLSVKPNDTLSLLASATYQHDASNDSTAVYYYPPAGRSLYSYNSAVPTVIRSNLFIGSLVIDQELGGGHLTLTGTYATDKSRNTGDGTPFATAFGVPVPTNVYQPSSSKTKIAELRYTSDPAKPLRFVLGLYYNTRDRDFRQESDQAALIPFYGTGRLYRVFAQQTASELAGFGEATWAFAPRFEATAGVRVFRNSYRFQGDVSGLINNFFAPLTSSVTDVRNNQTSATPRFSLSFKPTPQVNIYATVSEGYRFGLTNYNSGANGGTPLTYKSDTLWNYEAGVKASMWDGRASLNTSIFYIDWSNIQLTFRNANGQGYITNAGDARSYGLESEFSFRPTPAFELNATVSVGKAELTKGNPGIVRRQGSIRGPEVLGVLAGDRLPGSQEVSASGGIQYNLRNVGGGDAYVRVDDVYVGPSYVDFMKAGSLQLGDYNLVNVRVGYKIRNIELVVFADNAFNSAGVVNAVPNADLVGFTDAAYRVKPRTIGVTLRAKY